MEKVDPTGKAQVILEAVISLKQIYIYKINTYTSIYTLCILVYFDT